MNRNSNSHFANIPTVNIERSKFNRPQSVKFTGNVGKLIPFYVDEVLPGDTFSVDTSMVVRLQSLKVPLLDDLFLDTYYFFVPNRLVWPYWKNFMGESNSNAWAPTAQYELPTLKAPAGGWSKGTIADYMGIPTGVENITVNALPIRAYCLICNEWFRSEALQPNVQILTSGGEAAGSNGINWITDMTRGGMPFNACKTFDYFTGALPAPQRGDSVSLNVIGDVPVVPKETDIDESLIRSGLSTGIHTKRITNDEVVDASGNISVFGTLKNSGNVGTVYPGDPKVVFSNLYADMSGISVATINQLRYAFQLQKLLEKDALYGGRYISQIYGHFGVKSPDARLQRPEYLGGKRIAININQVVQTSGSMDGSTPQGNVAGYSLTGFTNSDFTHSFTEHGFVIGVCVARYHHTYQQGIERMWNRRTRWDYYYPVFAHIGEQAIKVKELYATGNSTDDDVFGYQEAWAEYRYKPNRVAGEMRSNYQTSLDMWHLADDYNSQPMLSSSWIREDHNPVNRALAVNSSVSDQLLFDVLVNNVSTRPMPLYSVPGLIDHF